MRPGKHLNGLFHPLSIFFRDQLFRLADHYPGLSADCRHHGANCVVCVQRRSSISVNQLEHLANSFSLGGRQESIPQSRELWASPLTDGFFVLPPQYGRPDAFLQY
jgi:hypothetical protein